MSEVESRRVSLETLAGGDVLALFQQELQKAPENIGDPNTPWKAKRSVTLTIAIHPNEERDFGIVEIDCFAKLPRAKPLGTQLFVGVEGGQVVAYEQTARQPQLTDSEGRVLSMSVGRK
jgi:hypothetical protein